jgi:hypothetical protein
MTDTPTHPPAAVRIKEALEALRVLRAAVTGGPMQQRVLAVVESALEAAQQEASAWEALEAWGAEDVRFLAPDEIADTWDVVITLADGQYNFDAPSRLEALTKAAEFCRAEIGK